MKALIFKHRVFPSSFLLMFRVLGLPPVKLAWKSPQSGKERSRKVFTRVLNRSVPFYGSLFRGVHFLERNRTERNGTERNGTPFVVLV